MGKIFSRILHSEQAGLLLALVLRRVDLSSALAVMAETGRRAAARPARRR